ncbi:hypothetical protein Tco_1203430 [Tanacetum coccineum]
MPPKSAPLTQAGVRRMIKESVDAAIVAERARHANAGNDARGSGPVRGQDVAPVVRECTFSGFMKCNPTVFQGVEGAVELRRWFEKTESVFGINECAESKKVNSLMLFGVTAALIDVNAAQSKLVLLENFNENYSKCLRLLVEVTTASTKLLLLEEVTTARGITTAEGVNAASKEVSTADLRNSIYLKWDQQVVSELVALRNFARIEMDQDFDTHDGCSEVPRLQNGGSKKIRSEGLEEEAFNDGNSMNISNMKTSLLTRPQKMLDQTFDRLQNLVSQLELLDEKLSQEDVNQKLLRSLSPEWNTHAVVWRNKAELETMSMDDLYNKPSVPNEVVNVAHEVTIASTQVNTAYSTNIDNLSDFASQPNSPHLAHEDLQQIHPDDIEEMD